jgi:hypothetical protein
VETSKIKFLKNKVNCELEYLEKYRKGESRNADP